MIAVGSAVAHGSNTVGYAMKESKAGSFFSSNLLESRNPEEIFQEMEKLNDAYSTRCKNKYMHFVIGIAPQDQDRLTNGDLYKIIKEFSHRMGLENHP